MNYRTFVDAKKYPGIAGAYETIGEWGNLTVIALAEVQLPGFIALCKTRTGRSDFSAQLYGEDRRYYTLTDGVPHLQKYPKHVPYTAQEFDRAFRKNKRRKAAYDKKGAVVLAQTEAEREKRSLFRFKPGVYVGKAKELWFPYRVKFAKTPGQPLLVFFHGGGSAGADNLRPLWEYRNGPYPELFPWRKRKQLLKKDFTVLIPQCGRFADYGLPAYIAAVKELSEKVAADAGADTGRIYCMGLSMGGRCTWLSAYLFPDHYACAMPMMGELDHPALPDPLTPESLSHMKDLPIWVSHSEDDTVLPINRDDETVAVLRELGAPVKYTRVDGKGHHCLVPYFLRTEPWAEWMFAQKKPDRQEGNNG